MFENMINFFKKLIKKEKNKESSDTAKERLHLVLMQDRANVSADFLELMRKEIIEVIKKYVDVDEKEIDVHLTNKANDDGTLGAPALYANIPIVTIKNEARKANIPFEQKVQEELKQNNEKDEETKENSKIENREKDVLSEENKQTENTIKENSEIKESSENKEKNIEENKEIEKSEETTSSNN